MSGTGRASTWHLVLKEAFLVRTESQTHMHIKEGMKLGGKRDCGDRGGIRGDKWELKLIKTHMHGQNFVLE